MTVDQAQRLPVEPGARLAVGTRAQRGLATSQAGEVPERWQDQPEKVRQKDVDARWTLKNHERHDGYKNHVKVDTLVCIGAFPRGNPLPPTIHLSIFEP